MIVADRCFTFFGVIAPGKASDQVASSEHQSTRENGIGNGEVFGWQCSASGFECCAGAIYRSQREDAGKDAFNFFLSRLRFRIEMAFGLLQTKWCFLYRPLQVNLATAAMVFQACARLHNFCLCEDYNAGIDLNDESILKEIRT